MTPAKGRQVVLVALVVAAVAWVVLSSWQQQGAVVAVPWSTSVVLIALTLAVLAAGLEVRRWLLGRRRRPLDPLIAARVAALGKAAAYAGGALSGWYAAQVLVVLPDAVGTRRTRLLLAAVAGLIAIALCVVGLVVQRWCRLPPGENGTGDSAAQGPGYSEDDRG